MDEGDTDLTVCTEKRTSDVLCVIGELLCPIMSKISQMFFYRYVNYIPDRIMRQPLLGDYYESNIKK